jgi:hypothetical protein
MAQMGYSGAWGKLMHEKNLESKSRVRLPLRIGVGTSGDSVSESGHIQKKPLNFVYDAAETSRR